MPIRVPLSDDARFPLLPAARRGLLQRLRQHPHAPRWNLSCGDRLDQAGYEALGRWSERLAAGPPAWRPGELPDWLLAFTARAVATVPFYRGRGGGDFHSIPTLRRADLAATPWAFVPDDRPLDDLLVYPTSGSTGPAFEVYSHPFASNAYLPFLVAALARVGVILEGGPEHVSLATVHAQRDTYTYPSLMSWLGGAGCVKVNLNEGAWRDPADRVAFLDDCAPEVYAGDPLAFAALAELPLRHRPKALVSSATALLPGWRAALVARFGAPVIDLYSLTEARLIGVCYGQGHEVLAPDLYVELLDPVDDRPTPPGARGEIVVSGGHNPFLPLLRYRTGDFARLEHRPDRVVLRDLEGRPPVCLLDHAGGIVNTIDVSRVLAPFALVRFQLHQAADRALTLRVDGSADPGALQAALQPLFGALPLSVRPVEAVAPGRKLPSYVSEVVPPARAAVFEAPRVKVPLGGTPAALPEE